jgi:dolichol-phosphate mannosyltransferase
MIGFGITNISLGIIAEYLWRTLDASRKRPIYIVDEVIALPAPVQKFANE